MNDYVESIDGPRYLTYWVRQRARVEEQRVIRKRREEESRLLQRNLEVSPVRGPSDAQCFIVLASRLITNLLW